jgi:hypothetical protein
MNALASGGFAALMNRGSDDRCERDLSTALTSLKFLPHEKVDACTLGLLAAHRHLVISEKLAAEATARATVRQHRREHPGDHKRDSEDEETRRMRRRRRTLATRLTTRTTRRWFAAGATSRNGWRRVARC